MRLSSTSILCLIDLVEKMRVLRIHLKQTSANYRREETIENKMTYPLPPFSTVIGALHQAAHLKEYHNMDISIQGDYRSLSREPYTDYCFLNSTQDDRGILVKMYNENLLSKGYQRVGKALKSQGNSFQNGVTISVENEALLEEYQDLRKLNEEIKAFKKGKFAKCMSAIKTRKATLARKKKELDKKSEKYLFVEQREKEIKEWEKKLKNGLKEYELEHYQKPYSKFRTLTTSLKYYEILHEVELILHVQSDEKIMELLLKNIHNLKSLGRSEDFVEVISAEMVELQKEIDKKYCSRYHAYISADLLKSEDDVTSKIKTGISAQGTKYYLNKKYTKDKVGRRIFEKKEKKKVVYLSNYSIDEDSDLVGKNVYIDKTPLHGEKNTELIVNLI